MELCTDNPAIYIETKAANAGIDIDDLCDAAGVARSTLTRWKNKTNGATFGTVQKFEKALTKLISKKEGPKTKHTPRSMQKTSEGVNSNIT